jgi:hypothetical protein
LTSAYNVGESSIRRLAGFVRPHTRPSLHRRGSGSEDSEKGLEEDSTSIDSVPTRSSEDSVERGSHGKYWGIWKSEEDRSDGYFSLPPTPPEKGRSTFTEFEAALRAAERSIASTSLPTPAVSSHSLSRPRSRRSRRVSSGSNGWIKTLLSGWVGSGSGKTGEVIRELGWTVGLLVGLFFVTLGVVFWMIKGMPM